MRTSARPVALVLFPEVDLLDVAAVGHVLSLAGRQWNWRPFRVIPVAAEAGRVETRGQIAVEATRALTDDLEPEIVVVPGGYGARRASGDAELIAWVARAGRAATHVVSIGAGAGLVAAAGLAAGRRLTCAKEDRPWLTELANGATLEVDRPVVVDAPLLSAAASGHAVAVSLALVRAILGDKQARLVAERLGLDAPPSLPAVPSVVEIKG